MEETVFAFIGITSTIVKNVEVEVDFVCMGKTSTFVKIVVEREFVHMEKTNTAVRFVEEKKKNTNQCVRVLTKMKIKIP